MQKEIILPNHVIGESQPVFVIAEAGVNHNGDLDLARKLIDVAADAGVDAVKFQTFRAEKLVTSSAKQAAYQTRNTGAEESQLEMLKRLELPYEAHADLKTYAEGKGLVFMSTPFDEEAIDFLFDLGVCIFKAGSGELTNLPYLKKMADKGIPLILSTGMAVMEEIQQAVDVVLATGNDKLALLQCTTNYPAAYEDANLNAMGTLQREFRTVIGYSDHTEGIIAPVTAVAMGATIIEKHFTLDRNLPGPDHKASLEPDELTEMMRQIRLVETMKGTGEKIPTQSEKEISGVARKSIVAAFDIPAGTMLTAEMLVAKRPGSGISPARMDDVVGKVAKRDIPKDDLLGGEDFE
ncbi:N-acetylneuraminate synthase [bacterium]|nr:N-acetylneuraminate synthase [bacterium]